MNGTFSIGDLAREFGVTLRTLRFYEDKRLLSPRRRGPVRLYSRRDRARLKLILLGKRVGFSLSQIKEMLDLYELKDGKARHLKAALARFSAHVEVLRHQKEDIEQAIRELTHTMGIVAGMLRDREERGDFFPAAEPAE
jgi:DNA-binding transcriptional MerR regulator